MKKAEPSLLLAELKVGGEETFIPLNLEEACGKGEGAAGREQRPRGQQDRGRSFFTGKKVECRLWEGEKREKHREGTRPPVRGHWRREQPGAPGEAPK